MSDRAPRRWPGHKPLSEPESRFVHEQMQSFKPHLIVSIHAPYGVLDFDGPSVPPSKLGRLYLDQVGIFPGSLGNYGGVHKGVPVVTIEDLKGSVQVLCFNENYDKYAELLVPGKAVMVTGEVHNGEEKPKIFPQEIVPLDDIPRRLTKQVHLRLNSAQVSPAKLESVHDSMAGSAATVVSVVMVLTTAVVF